MLETQLARIAAAIPPAESGGIPGQPEQPVEKVNAITIQGEGFTSFSVGKTEDPGCPTIGCSVERQYFNNALCDLGASVSVMPRAVFEKLNYRKLSPTPIQLQLADGSIRHPIGVAEDILVRIQGAYIPVDFVVLETDTEGDATLILGATVPAHHEGPDRCCSQRA